MEAAMRRVTSMIFIGGWASFFGTVSAATSLALVSAGFPAASRLPVIGEEVRRIAEILVANGNPAVLAASIAALAFGAAMLLLMLSMWMLQGEDRLDRTAGERLAMATLGFTALVVCVFGLLGMDFMTEQVSVGGILLVLVLSVLGVLFDRTVEIDEAEEAREEAFYRNALLVGRRFGQDAAFVAAEEPAPEARR